MNGRYLNHVLKPEEIHLLVGALRTAVQTWNTDAQTAATDNQDRISQQFQKQVQDGESLLEQFESFGY